MATSCTTRTRFRKGQRVVSAVAHPPEVRPGTQAVIDSPRLGRLYVVQLPNGEIHRWMARFELEPLDRRTLIPGTRARILTDKGHPPQVRTGMVVKILKSVYTPYYDVYLQGTTYHRWFADFEIFPESVLRS